MRRVQETEAPMRSVTSAVWSVFRLRGDVHIQGIQATPRPKERALEGLEGLEKQDWQVDDSRLHCKDMGLISILTFFEPAALENRLAERQDGTAENDPIAIRTADTRALSREESSNDETEPPLVTDSPTLEVDSISTLQLSADLSSPRLPAGSQGEGPDISDLMQADLYVQTSSRGRCHLICQLSCRDMIVISCTSTESMNLRPSFTAAATFPGRKTRSNRILRHACNMPCGP